MIILAQSGEFKEILQFKNDDREAVHRLGCIKAIQSRKVLGAFIATSLLADFEEQSDYFCTLVPALLWELIERTRE